MDEIAVEILEDGTIKITTDQVSTANHINADRMLKQLAVLMGTAPQTQKRKQAQTRAKAVIKRKQ